MNRVDRSGSGSGSGGHYQAGMSGAVAKPVPFQSPRFPRYDTSRPSSTVDAMSLIPETEEAVFPNSTNLYDRDPLRREDDGGSQASSSSLFRRITTRLSSPRISSPVPLPHSIPLTSLKSLRRQQGSGYSNLQEADDDYHQVPVDLSSLSGLGFQLTEAEKPRDSPWLNQDTTYQSPRPGNAKPGFKEFVERRKLGDGLVVGARVSRDPSIRRSNSPNTRAQEVQRTQTVRKAAQNYAEQRNMIVAMTEPVDLSFFEGHPGRQTGGQSFDNILTRSTTIDDTPMSYFFPKEVDVPSWRPKTMSTPYILFLMATAFALAGCQEYLCLRSQQLEEQHSGILAFDDVDDISVGVFFVWKYLPTMITIIYAVLFSIMDFDIRRLEAFYQLSQPRGSPASESLCVDHLTTFQYFVPFKAFRLQQWTVFFSTIGNIIASTVSPALQNPSVDFDTNEICRRPGDRIECPTGLGDVKRYVVVIEPRWSRCLSVSYAVMGLICVILFFQLRRKTGLLSDPKGIAGIASMATKSHILRDFKGTDLCTREDIQKRLAHRRFILYNSSIWQGQWNTTNEYDSHVEGELKSPLPPMLRWTTVYPFIAAQVLCLIAVPVISMTKANVIPNTVPWLPILIATILKLIWSTFEADVRLMEPFYRLARGNATPENSLTLDYQSTVYGILPFKAAYNGHWLLCLVGLCSVALDALSVTVSSFSIQADLFYNQVEIFHPGDANGSGPDSDGDETKVSFWVSVLLSMFILTVVILTTILVYIRRRHPLLPREPSTIASILGYIYASNMLEDFIGTERLTNKEMEEKLKQTKKRYSLGWYVGRDRQIHCAIDQGEVRSRYVHGKPYIQAMAGPVEEV